MACEPPTVDEPEQLPIWAPTKKDAGTVEVLPPDAGPAAPEVYAGEACPPESFGLDEGEEIPDGSVRFGLCVKLHQLTANATLNGVPVQQPVQLDFHGGAMHSEITRSPSALGELNVKVMRGRYDLFQYQPGGVFPTHTGFLDLGSLDMTRDQFRNLAAKSHRVRGAVTLGGVPFRPQTWPADVQLDALGTPRNQNVTTSNQAGSYEVELLEGVFALFLSSPAAALQGTELTRFLATQQNVVLTSDQVVDIEIPAQTFEGRITIDGEPIPDRIASGPDYTLSYVVPGETEAAVQTYHEGGSPNFAALVPQGNYSVLLNFMGAPDLHLPSQIWNQQLSTYMVFDHEQWLEVDLPTHRIEGGLLIDGRPVRPNPNYNWSMYLYGFAGAAQTQHGLMYEVPLVSSTFNLRAFRGNYFSVLWLDENLYPELAEGFYIVNRYLQVQADTQMPIDIETQVFTGRLLVDGKPPPDNEIAGRLIFRNRALEAQWSTFFRRIRCGPDGSFIVRLPKGEYEVYFQIDNDTFPEHASGTQLLLSRLKLDTEAVTQDLAYDTVLVTGPIRVGGMAVADTIGGPEVGLELNRVSDSRTFTWNFEGGKDSYRLRVPRGRYDLDFVIHQGAFDGVAWGEAPMGLKMTAAAPGDDIVPTDK